MVARNFARLVLMIALLFAPLGMLSSHAAMAVPLPHSTAGHHDGMSSGDHCATPAEQEKSDDGAAIDCRTACAAVPAAPPLLAMRSAFAPMPAPMLPARPNLGLNPAADPPPPRFC